MDNKMLHHSKAAVFIYKTELIPIPKYSKYKHTHTHTYTLSLQEGEQMCKVKIHCTKFKNLMKMRKQKIKNHNICVSSQFHMKAISNVLYSEQEGEYILKSSCITEQTFKTLKLSK